MNYQSFLDGAQVNQGPRQAPSPAQGMNHTNGMNGGPGMPNGMGMPTPAGHQADLNFIYQLVEEFGRIITENRSVTENVMESLGAIRQRASEQGLSNDHIIASVASELNESGKNLELENTMLRRKLEESEHERQENLKLSFDYAKVMGRMLKDLHAFKLKQVEDTCAWHRSYRAQLEYERAENLRLRVDIDARIEAARRGNEALRKFRREWDENKEINDLKVQLIAKRQEARFYKRMALRHVPDDDPIWSDDDDLIDHEEKKRLAEEELKKRLLEETKESDILNGQ